MDEIDRASETEEILLGNAIRRARNSPLVVFPEGVCLQCEAELPIERQRFCDHHCAADWQKRNTIKRKQGG